jgi:protein-tyrosine phosphatase
MSEAIRHVPFEACFNFRDLGGYRTADGRRIGAGQIYRSDTLHRLTDADAATFRSLGIRTVVDLRSRTEVDDHGRIEIADSDFVWHNVPMSDEIKLAPRGPDQPPPDLANLSPGESYALMTERYADSLGTVFTILSGPDALPAVFHCTSGKDRTGIVAALLLDLLGVPDQTIIADYVLTEEANDRSMVWIEAHEPDFAAYLAEIPYERRAPRPEKIAGFLERFRAQFGSAEEFLVNVGITNDRLDDLRERLLSGG